MSEKNNLWNFILSKNHIIPSPIANKIGVPVIRTILSNLAVNLRRVKNCRPKTVHEKKLLSNGIVVIPNFLPDDEFQDLKKEFNQIISKKNINISNIGSTNVLFSSLKKNDYSKYEAIKKFSKNKKLIRLICVAEGMKLFDEIKTLIFEKTNFGNPEKDTDPNKLFHADVHFHSHKVLYYIEDVSNDNGPFAYCKKSHQNSLERLYFELRRGQLRDGHINSWRIINHQQKNFFKNYYNKLMKNKIDITGKANTLIITNVHGFHRRGDGVQGKSRSLIRIPFRHNPLGHSKKLLPSTYTGKLL